MKTPIACLSAAAVLTFGFWTTGALAQQTTAGGAAGGGVARGGAAVGGQAQPGSAGVGQAGAAGANQPLNSGPGANPIGNQGGNLSPQMFAPPPLNLPSQAGNRLNGGTQTGAIPGNAGVNTSRAAGRLNGRLTPPGINQRGAGGVTGQSSNRQGTAVPTPSQSQSQPDPSAAAQVANGNQPGNLGNDVVNGPMSPQLHEGRWWQSLPNNQWAYWNDNGWARFQGADYRGDPSYYGQRYQTRAATDLNSQNVQAGSNTVGSVGANVAGSRPSTSPQSLARAAQSTAARNRATANQTAAQSAAGAANVNPGQQTSAPQSGYRWYDSRWWFQMPQNDWAYWGGDGWIRFQGADYSGQPQYLGDRYQMPAARQSSQ